MNKNITKKNIEKIKDLRSKFPAQISAKVSRSEDGGFVAEILSFPGCVTQGETLSELVEMVNDCVKTYLDVPQKRERLIILAVRKNINIPFLFPKEKDYTISMREALKNCPISDDNSFWFAKRTHRYGW